MGKALLWTKRYAWCNLTLSFDLKFVLQIVLMLDCAKTQMQDVVVEILEGVGVEKPDDPVDGHK